MDTPNEPDPLGDAVGEDDRLEAERALITDSDNTARPEDGDQPPELDA